MRILHLSIQELERSMTHLALIRTGPKLSTPEQCERWSDLMPLLTWQLWLAKDVVKEIRLPWQTSLPELTPGRVVQSMLPLSIKIGTRLLLPNGEETRMDGKRENFALQDVALLFSKRVKVGSKNHQNRLVNLGIFL